MFECGVCSAEFQWQDKFDEHLRINGHAIQCPACSSAFGCQQHLEDHVYQSGHWSQCDICARQFYTERECIQHMDSSEHWKPVFPCETCAKSFQTQKDAHQHMNATSHWGRQFVCEGCGKKFDSQHAADTHMSATGHRAPQVPCETCGKKFLTQDDADKHMTDASHWALRYPCQVCPLEFYTREAAQYHMGSFDHFANYCSGCNQGFQNEHDLKMHLNSQVHRVNSVTCPFCNVGYKTASHLTYHLETGSCPRARGLTRDTMQIAIQRRDPRGVITFENSHEAAYLPTRQAWNGMYWECYICHKEFVDAPDLGQHVNSRAHKQNSYHCPNQRCEKQFISLAALFNHLEGESCAYMRFDKVQACVSEILGGNRQIAFT